MRAGIARHIQPALGVDIMTFQLFPGDRPVVAQAVQRFQPQILFGKAVAGAAPMQRLAAKRHRHRDHAFGLLILDEVVVPGVLAVGQGAAMVLPAVLAIDDGAAGLDDGDAEAGPEFGEALDQHRGGDAAADHANVGFMDRHG
jgi:hypothetical protein